MISLVLCTHNPSIEFLSRALAAVKTAMDRGGPCELIIVDNASSVDVGGLDVVSRSGARVVQEPVLGLTAARERASREAAGELVVFIDDDNVIDADYLKIARSLFLDTRIGMMSGQIVPEYQSAPPRWIRSFEAQLAIRRPTGTAPQLTNVPMYSEAFPVGAGCVIRTGILRDYFKDSAQGGRIEGRLGDSLLSGEDTDIALFAISKGYLIGCSPYLRMIHLIPESRVKPGYLIRLADGTIESCARVNRKWKLRFGHDVFPHIGDSAIRIGARFVVYALLAWRAPFRIRARTQLAMLRQKVFVK